MRAHVLSKNNYIGLRVHRPNLKRSGKGKLRNELVGAHELENAIDRDETPKTAAETMIAIFNVKFSCRKETGLRFVSLNISLSHS